ncbi:S4 domain-containing protein YaaA [Marinicrinis sediminis]|uniref:S4 domain-containing protein YaaA n=1 Tax=Marinicrinis sediminis TaxID=1652465 RepID=A0ABW5RB37_9BACL
MATDVHISDAYITLGQLLKKLDLVSTGGQVKFFLAETAIIVNGEAENRRGKKLWPGDQVHIEGHGAVQITN